MERNGISKLDLKRLNRTGILKLIVRYGPMSRIDLAQHLNLTRAAVTIITNEMIEQGILYEKGEQKIVEKKASRGRKKILLDLQENYRLSFGIVIDFDKIKIGLSNLKGQTLDKRKISYSAGTPLVELVERIDLQVREILEDNCLALSGLLGIGLCISGNSWKGLGGQEFSEQIKTSFKKMLEIRFPGVPVIVDSTTECLALAEVYFHPAPDNYPQNIVFIRYGYDVDAAIMLEDRIYRGAHGNPGWFSHLVVDAKGERCECGKIGCCVTRMSIWRIIEKIKDLYVQGKTPLLAKETGGKVENVDFRIENLKSILADSAVKELYEQALEYLTTALDNLFTILDPDTVVLFGFVFDQILDLDMLNQIMEQEHNYTLKDKVRLSTISDSNVHLAGNALCLQKCFLDKGGQNIKG